MLQVRLQSWWVCGMRTNSSTPPNANAHQCRQRGAGQPHDDWLDRASVEVVKFNSKLALDAWQTRPSLPVTTRFAMESKQAQSRRIVYKPGGNKEAMAYEQNQRVANAHG